MLDVFAGMDGFGHALESHDASKTLGRRLGVVAFEIDDFCRRLLLDRRKPGFAVSAAPDTQGRIGSVLALTDHDGVALVELLGKLPKLRHLMVIGGSPCVGFSAANP